MKKVDPQKYLQNHFPFLCSQWMKEKLHISRFPYSLLNCSELKNFYENHVGVIFPFSFDQDQQEVMEDVARTLDVTVAQLIEENLPVIMGNLSPYIIASVNCIDLDKYRLSKSKSQVATRRFNCLKRIIGEERITNLIDKKLGEITLELVKCTCLPEQELNENMILPPSTSLYNHHLDIVSMTLEDFAHVFSLDESLIGILASRRLPLHELLLGLQSYIGHADDVNTMQNALLSIEVTTKCIITHLKESLIEVQAYIVRGIINMLTLYVGNLYKIAPRLIETNNKILFMFCNEALSSCPEILANHIHVIITRLLPLLEKQDNMLLESTKSVIECFFSSNNDNVKNSLSLLQPFLSDSSNTSLQRLNRKHNNLIERTTGTDMISQIQRFINTNFKEVSTHSVINLLNLLKNNKRDWHFLYEDSTLNNNNNLPHQVCFKLFEILSETSNLSMKKLAAQCLGEIGPIPLGNSVFPLKNNTIDDSVFDNVHSYIIIMLNKLLSHENIIVIELASDALLKVLKTHEGFNAARQDSEVLREVLPLMPSRKPAKSSVNTGLGSLTYHDFVNQTHLWKSIDFEEWVTGLAYTLITAGCNDSILFCIDQVCKINCEFSSQCLPFIFHSAIKSDVELRRDPLSNLVNTFFRNSLQICNGTSNDADSNSVSSCKKAVHVMLNVIDYLRKQTPNDCFSKRDVLTIWDKNLWLELDYLLVAEVSYLCGAHLSALVFIELYCEKLQDEIKMKDNYCENINNRFLPTLQKLSSEDSMSKLNVLLLKIYSAIGDVDGIEGCGGNTDSCLSTRSLRSQHRGVWMHSFAVDDAADCTSGIIDGLKSGGLYNTLSKVVNSISLSQASLDVINARWECAWRLGDWNDSEMEDITSNQSNSLFHFHQYQAMKCLHLHEISGINQHIESARNILCDQLKGSVNESTSCIYPHLAKFKVVSELENTANSLSELKNLNKIEDFLSNVCKNWKVESTFGKIDFTSEEIITSSRISTLQALNSVVDNTSIIHDLLIDKSKLCRKNPKVGMGNCEHSLKIASMLNITEHQSWITQLETAQVSLFVGDQREASNILEKTINLISNKPEDELSIVEKTCYCKALLLYGKMMIECQLKPLDVIKEQYLERVVNMIERNRELNNDLDILEDCYHQLALYGDKLYDDVYTYLQSDSANLKRENIKKYKEELSLNQSLLRDARTHDDQRAYK